MYVSPNEDSPLYQIPHKTRPSYAWHVRPLHWTRVTRVTRVTTDQCDLGDEVDQSGQGDEDYLGVLGCGRQ